MKVTLEIELETLDAIRRLLHLAQQIAAFQDGSKEQKAVIQMAQGAASDAGMELTPLSTELRMTEEGAEVTSEENVERSTDNSAVIGSGPLSGGATVNTILQTQT